MQSSCANGTNLDALEQNLTSILQQNTKEISNVDFSTKPLIIDQPGIYKLRENILLDLNKSADNRVTTDLASEPPFVLDFFAGIIVKTANVIIDLNGMSIAMTESFALRQRFFSIVELASTPFMPGQGPADFGDTIDSSSYVLIKNGTIGRTSHHGIRGNKTSNILLKNVQIVDFEVAGIALNGGKCLKAQNTNVGPNYQNLAVNGFFSAARFLPKFYSRLQSVATPEEWKEAQTKFQALDNTVNNVIAEILTKGFTTNETFKNESKLPDGNNYGVLIHPPGLAVHDYIAKNYADMVEDVNVTNIVVKEIKVKVKEVVGISSNKDGTGIQLDPSGSVFPIFDLTDYDGTYKGNVLSDAQIVAADIANKHGLKLGKLSISPDVVEWAREENHVSSLLQLGYKYKCNGDVMYHLVKPVHGFRFDGVKRLKVKHCTVQDVVNIGYMGNDTACGSYEKNHEQQQRTGYHGSDANGFCFSGVQDVDIHGCSVNKIHSDNGSSVGFRFINGCKNVKVQSTLGSFITAGQEFTSGHWYGKNHLGEISSFSCDFPNRIPDAVGLKIEDADCDVRMSRLQFSNLDAPGSAVPIWISTI